MAWDSINSMRYVAESRMREAISHAQEAERLAIAERQMDVATRLGDAIGTLKEALRFSGLPASKTFRVAAISSNSNSFGLRQYIMVAQDGEAWSVLRSDYTGASKLEKGDEISTTISMGRADWSRNSRAMVFEAPMQMSPAGGAIVKEVWG